MRRKRSLAWVLLSVCLIMLFASVFPHQHHGDGMLCTQYDILPCAVDCQDAAHHHAGGQDCGNSCVTSFCCDAPHHSDFILPIFLFVIGWFTLAGVSRLLYLEKQVDDSVSSCYVERLHSYDGHDVSGLRAPPCA